MTHPTASEPQPEAPSPFVAAAPDYYRGSLFGAVRKTALRHPQVTALNFLGRKFTYTALMEHIEWFAAALAAQGIRTGDVVAIMLPNCPQAVIAFYAANKLGAIASVIHPLLSGTELQHALQLTGATLLVTMDIFYDRALEATAATRAAIGHSIHIVATRIVDELPFYARAVFRFRAKKNDLPPHKVADGGGTTTYTTFIGNGKTLCQSLRGVDSPQREGDLSQQPAAILFSGGTSGTPKGILLSNGNINAETWQIEHTISAPAQPGERILTALPLFHGFGLAVCLHFGLTNALTCMLVPRVTVRDYSKVLVIGKCNYVVGVPTLLGKIMDLPSMARADLSFVKEVVSGGDAIPREMKNRLDAFLEQRGSSAHVREGYGATECTAAFTVEDPQGGTASIGRPLHGNAVKIIDPATGAELPPGADGELLMCGPTVMQCYWGNPEETANTIELDAQGRRWLHTGDVARIGEDGLVYYRGRIKRMIICSGYNIYPNQIEAELSKLPEVELCCVRAGAAHPGHAPAGVVRAHVQGHHPLLRDAVGVRGLVGDGAVEPGARRNFRTERAAVLADGNRAHRRIPSGGEGLARPQAAPARQTHGPELGELRIRDKVHPVFPQVNGLKDTKGHRPEESPADDATEHPRTARAGRRR